MALFQRKQNVTMSAPLYTTGANKTILIAGLGNPGSKYDGTRHNIGFECLGAFAKAHEFPSWIDKKDLKSMSTIKLLGESRVVLCKPTTYMNLSGEAIQKIAHFYKIEPAHIVAVYDELDIPFGQLRMRVGGSDAGHNGIKSMIQHIGPDFGRVRVGIGGKPENIDGASFVLAKFSDKERAEINNLTREITSVLTEYIYRGELAPETRSFLA